MFTFVPEPGNEARSFGLGVYEIDRPAGPALVVSGEASGYEVFVLRVPEIGATVIGLFNRSQAGAAYDFIVENGLALLLDEGAG